MAVALDRSVAQHIQQHGVLGVEVEGKHTRGQLVIQHDKETIDFVKGIDEEKFVSLLQQATK